MQQIILEVLFSREAGDNDFCWSEEVMPLKYSSKEDFKNDFVTALREMYTKEIISKTVRVGPYDINLGDAIMNVGMVGKITLDKYPHLYFKIGTDDDGDSSYMFLFQWTVYTLEEWFEKSEGTFV